MTAYAENALHYFFHLGTQEYGRISGAIGGIFPVPPLVLRIVLTSRCNLRCGYCYQADVHGKKEESHLSLEEWRTLFEKLPSWTVIDLSGGEPFIAKDFKAWLALLLSFGFKVSLITNGTVYDEEILESLVAGGLTYLMVSVDGLERTHNAIRGNPRAHQSLKRFLLKLNELKKKSGKKLPLICAKTTVTEENYKELLPLQDYVFDELGVQAHSLNLLFQNPARGGGVMVDTFDDRFFKGNSAKISAQKAKEISLEIGKLSEKARKRGRPLFLKPDIAPDEVERYFLSPSSYGVKSCRKRNSVATLYYDGSIAPCDLTLKVSHVKDLGFDLKKLWAEKRFVEFESGFKKFGGFHPACDGCSLMRHTRRHP